LMVRKTEQIFTTVTIRLAWLHFISQLSALFDRRIQ